MALFTHISVVLILASSSSRQGSIEVEYFVHFDEPVTDFSALEVGRSTTKGLMKNNYLVRIGDELFNITASHVLLNENNNVTACESCWL